MVHRRVGILIVLICAAASCRRPLRVPPPPVETLETHWNSIAQWLSEDADIIVTVDLKRLRNLPGFSTLARQFQSGVFAPSSEGDFATVLCRVDPARPIPACYGLLQTPTDSMAWLAAATTAAGTAWITNMEGRQQTLIDPTGQVAFRALTPRLILGGNTRGLQWFWQRKPAASAAISRPLSNAIAPLLSGWGHIHLNETLRHFLPASWRGIDHATITLETDVRLTWTVTFHLPDMGQAIDFASRLEGVLTLGAVTLRDTPWLTEMVRSATVHREETTVALRWLMPREIPSE